MLYLPMALKVNKMIVCVDCKSIFEHFFKEGSAQATSDKLVPTSVVGLSGVRLQRELINGQPSGAACGADAANDQFDGKQALTEEGVPDDAFDLEVEGGADGA